MPVESEIAAIRASQISAGRIRADLSGWYRAHARTLPWRAPPGSSARTEAYRVWLSEVMLQQTTVAAVIPYFETFTARWPTLADLAAADPADVLAAWAGLGYYSRARNLIACAAVVMRDHGGAFPDNAAALRTLPGIGDYTAAAIAAIGFGEIGAVPVDANIERVVARLFAIRDPLPGARKSIREAAVRLWPTDGSGGDFAQAMMDLGSDICAARKPSCGRCPLADDCRANALGIAADLPVKPAKKSKPLRFGRANWIVRGGETPLAEVWLVRRPDRGMLGGMRALPGGDWGDSAGEALAGSKSHGPVRHVFTHFALDLFVDVAGDAALAVGEGEWWPITRLDEAGLPTLYRRAAAIALGE
jgi:A/G-specific adenine glycosylase